MNKQEALSRMIALEQMRSEGCPNLNEAIDFFKSIVYAPEKKKSNWFVPKSGERFLYIDSWGEVMESSCVEPNRHFFKRNKFFRVSARHLAERESKRQAAEIKYLKAIADGNEGKVLDWNDGKQEKWSADFDFANNKINFECYSVYKNKHSDFWSVSLEAAKAAVACLTHEEKELVFKS